MGTGGASNGCERRRDPGVDASADSRRDSCFAADHGEAMTKRSAMTVVALGGVALFGLVQLVPYGRDHENPRVVHEPAWDSPSTRALAVRACFDCHSNETRWPWYSHVAPASWLVRRDVEVGRQELNFSDWTGAYEEEDESAESVIEGEMPPAAYRLLHSSARLSADERNQLARGLAATFGASLSDSLPGRTRASASAE